MLIYFRSFAALALVAGSVVFALYMALAYRRFDFLGAILAINALFLGIIAVACEED